MADVLIGGTPARANSAYWATNGTVGHPWVAIADLKSRHLERTAERITDEGVRRSNVKLLPADTVVMSFKLSIGRTAVLTTPMYTNEAIAGFRTGDGLDSSFLRHSLEHYDYSELADEAVKGATLNKAKLQSLDLLLPPLPEQRAIAAVLDAVDDTIERTEAVIAATEELRRALLHELLTRGVPGMHSEWKHVPGLGTVPACWEVTTLGECLDGIEAGRSPLAESRSARDGEWGVLKVSSVSWGDFRPQENKALIAGTQPEPRFEVRPGDVLLSRANTPDLVGRAVLVKTTPAKLLLSDKTLRLIPNRARITREFLLVALSTPSARTQISGSASGSSRSMFNVSQEALRGTQLALPPLAEQRRIAELLTTAADTLASARDEADALGCMKVTLADELLSGSLRVGAKTEAPA
ncbi:MAG: restriction endonuclease subunit S [Gemmatimonadaceae bacterium]|nr:restriction endonuclease subunit S [Gemmatimonadaceae bacterium]